MIRKYFIIGIELLEGFFGDDVRFGVDYFEEWVHVILFHAIVRSLILIF